MNSNLSMFAKIDLNYLNNFEPAVTFCSIAKMNYPVAKCKLQRQGHDIVLSWSIVGQPNEGHPCRDCIFHKANSS